MATITKGKTFVNGELVTPEKLHQMVDAATLSPLVNADISTTAAIADTKLATISTAGKVSNSATTATNANTANTIVARDASGNFSAGTITASESVFNQVKIGRGAGNITTNTILGRNAFADNTIGIQNVAIGNQALQKNTEGNGNTAIGNTSLVRNTTGSYNITVGNGTLFYNTTGTGNIAVGNGVAYNNTDGEYNTAVGNDCLKENTSGSRNVALGDRSLYNNNGNANIGIGYFSNSSNTLFNNTACIGENAQITASNQIQLGASGQTTYAYGAVQDRSDERDKTDIRDTELGLDFVKALRPVDFKWDMREDYSPNPPQAPAENASEEEKAEYESAKLKWLYDVKLSNITHDGSKKRERFHHGLIAQEVKAVLDSKGIDFGGFQDHSVKGGDDVLSIGYNELIAPLIKAVQELAARVAALEAK
jgi:hypothetical protein